MEKQTRLTDRQMAEVVAEVSRLSQLREESLSRQQVEDILRDLELPTDLYDDALAQLQRKEALARERRRNQWFAALAATALIVLLALFYWRMSSHSATLAKISGESGRITRAADDGGALNIVTRDGQDAVFHVILRAVPLGEKLALSCQWTDPNGQIFKQNQWETRATDKTVWATSCKCQLGAAAPAGQWKVALQLGGRVLSETSFRVE